MSNFVLLEGLKPLEGFDVEVPGCDEPYRVGRRKGIRVALFELQPYPGFESFGFGTLHDVELVNWRFCNWGFLDQDFLG
jgi:hypothetical protein